MKNVKLFYLKTCPFCKRALGYLDELKAKNEEYAGVKIDMIEESENMELANKYDYNLVPTFYVDEKKICEGVLELKDVENVLKTALN